MRARFLLLLGLLCLPMARGEIRFAQLTDPHLFDPGQQATNEYVFQWCIDQINTSMAGGTRYAFVVVTGDIGIENLGGFSDANKTNAPGKRPDPSPQDIVRGAEVFARHISTSRVQRWLFIPGNNDLLQEDPKTISHYQTFIRTRASTITHPDAVESGGIWINIACAYGQAYSWVRESEKNVLEDEKMQVKPNEQSKPSEGAGEPAQQRALQWLNEQALIAVKQAVSRDRAWKERVAMLMGIKPPEPPPKSPEDADLDLVPFSKDTAFLAVIE